MLSLSMVYYEKNDLASSKKYFKLASELQPKLNDGVIGLQDIEKEGYYYTDNDIKIFKKLFDNVK